MSKYSAMIALFIGALFAVWGIAASYVATHPAAAVILAQMPPQ